MVAEARRKPETVAYRDAPRLAPPIPARSRLADYEAAADSLGIRLMPWQRLAARYITALNGRKWRYREVAVVVARQNGKTKLLVPRILMGIAEGETILHTAQNREIPRKTFKELEAVIAAHPTLDYRLRRGNGQEEIWQRKGTGHYKIVAPTASSRGESADIVLIDEVREQKDQELMSAIMPTIGARPDAQVIYLSNAGEEDSIILNDIRDRGIAGTEKRLAYLEWSADPERDVEDREGWAEANPALGHTMRWDTLEYFHRNSPVERFETEHLCRWVRTMLPRAVTDIAWERARAVLGAPIRPSMGIAADSRMRRASAVIAWQADERVNVHPIVDYAGSPVDLQAVADLAMQEGRRYGVRQIAFDPWSDRDFARFFKNPDPKPLQGAEWEAATVRFTEEVGSGRLRYDDPEGVLTPDIPYTVMDKTAHGFKAIAASSDERPTTASLAAIRAVWLATQNVPSAPKVY